ncbi:MAG: response regulator [Sedimenticola sp.]
MNSRERSSADIMVVDDNPANLRLLSDLLSSEGYNVRASLSGEMALKSISDTPPDLVLLDVKMPVIDGIEVCRRLKADEHTRAIPVIFISALGDTEKKMRGFEAGGVDYVTKPFASEEVLARVRTHLVLHDLQLQLEQRVAERTAELQEEVAERHMAEERLAEAQRLAQIGSWELDLGSGRLNWSDEMFNIFEIDNEQVEPTYEMFLEAIHPEDRELMEQTYRESLEKRQPYDIVHRLLMNDGRVKYVNECGWSQFEDDKPLRSLGTVQDVTQHQQLEETLRQAEKMSSIFSLATGMAHELNNPIAAIVMSIQNAARRLSSRLEKNIVVARKHGVDLERVSDYMKEREIPLLIESIFRSAERASEIINRLVKLTHRAEGDKAPADMVELMEEVIAQASADCDLEQNCHFEDIEILHDYDTALPAVLCHKDDIRRALLAVVTNAAQAMIDQERPPRITLHAKRRGSWARIEIEDNGPGIEAKVLKRIFEPFFTTSSPQRMGLGLATAYSIICDFHGGRMNAVSEPGMGTIITIELPLNSDQ